MKLRPAARLLAPLLLVAGRAAWAESSPSIDFIAPRNLATVLGTSVVELSVRVPEGTRVDHVIVSVDGKKIATLQSPPWTAPWNPGDGTEPHHLEAVVVLDDGRQARTSVRTSPLRIDVVEQVSLVNLYAIVRNRQGDYVSDLTIDRFHVTENGRPETIERFGADWKPLRIAIVLDTSLSMQDNDKLESARQAALGLLESLRPEDQGMVVAFSDAVKIVQPLTSDHAALAAAIQNTHAKGGTALYDALWATAEALEKADGRRVIVLLSDGKDEAASGLEPGSLHTEEEALDRSLRSEAMIFAIGVGRYLATEWDFARRRTLEAILREMAETTGGRAIFSSRAQKLQRAFDDVAEDLRHQYSLAYTSDDLTRDGKWRATRITIDRPDLVVVTRKGYFAPRDPAPKTR